jgi:hypothetical protein
MEPASAAPDAALADPPAMSLLDEIAASLKVPEAEAAAIAAAGAARPASAPPPPLPVVAAAPPAAGPRGGGGGLKKARAAGGAHLEDEATAAQLLLGIGTFSDSAAGSDDTQSAGRHGGAPSASAATGRASRADATGIRRSQRRGASSGRNPAVAAAMAAEGDSATEDEGDAAVPERAAASNRRPPSGAGRGRPPSAAGAAASAQRASAASGAAAAAATAAAAAAGGAARSEGGDLGDLPDADADGSDSPAAGGGGAHSAPAQKSELTLLCERFQAQFGHLQPDGSPQMLMLNDVAEALGVPRRRLYDVINVFESIEVMKRVGKLMYEFCGYDHLPGLLQQMAADEESGLPVEDRIRRAPTLIVVNEAGEEVGSGRGNSHSLWVLSRRLVRMLLKGRGAIALTAAAAVLVGPNGVADPSKHRSQTQITVERRLYDIGSILCSLGLVERVYMKKRQPAFEWVYGWRPGDAHPPPELAVAAASRLPAPPLALAPRRVEDGAARMGRRGGGGGRGGGGAAKRARVDPGAAAAMAGMQMPGFNPAMFGMFPGMQMPGMMPGGSNAMMAAMGGMGMMPDAGGGGGGGADGKGGGGGGMAPMPYFAHPGFFNPMAMQMAMTPAAAEGVGAGDEGAGAGAGSATAEGMAAAQGMMMWPSMASLMMHPAMMQMQQAQVAAAAQVQAAGGEGGVKVEGGEAEAEAGANAAAAAAAAAGQFAPMFSPWPQMMPGVAPMMPTSAPNPPQL